MPANTSSSVFPHRTQSLLFRSDRGYYVQGVHGRVDVSKNDFTVQKILESFQFSNFSSFVSHTQPFVLSGP